MAEKGKVKWFSNLKGFGFLQKTGDEKDVFVHYSFVQGDGYKKLKAGDEVDFDIEESPKGPQARNVVRTKKAEKPAEDKKAEAAKKAKK